MTTAYNSFEYTATGILGDKRRTMLENELHLRVRHIVFCVAVELLIEWHNAYFIIASRIVLESTVSNSDLGYIFTFTFMRYYNLH